MKLFLYLMSIVYLILAMSSMYFNHDTDKFWYLIILSNIWIAASIIYNQLR